MNLNARQHERRSILVAGRLLAGDTWHDCQILNISAGGAKLLIQGEFDRGKSLELEIGTFGSFTVAVSWRRSDEMGISFLDSPAVMADVVMGLAMYG